MSLATPSAQEGSSHPAPPRRFCLAGRRGRPLPRTHGPPAGEPVPPPHTWTFRRWEVLVTSPPARPQALGVGTALPSESGRSGRALPPGARKCPEPRGAGRTEDRFLPAGSVWQASPGGGAHSRARSNGRGWRGKAGGCAQHGYVASCKINLRAPGHACSLGGGSAVTCVWDSP